MALDFPASPTVGQPFGDWTWDGTKWIMTPVAAGGGGALPVGTIIDFYGVGAPSGFLACNGSTFDPLVYPDLEALLGGTTLPDLRDRSTIGISGSAALGATKGVSVATVPQHQHASTLAGPAHTHADNLAAPAHTHTDTLAAPAHTHDSGAASLISGPGGNPDFKMNQGTFYTFSQGPLVTSGASATALTGSVGAASATALTGSVGAASATALTGAIGNVSGVTVAGADGNYHPVLAVLKCIKAVP